jgi:hypothetical protein
VFLFVLTLFSFVLQKISLFRIQVLSFSNNFSFIFFFCNFFFHFIFTCHIWNMREVLVSCQEKLKKIIADFHVLGLFIGKKHYLSEKKFSVCHAPGPLPLPLPPPSPLNAKLVPRLQPRP